MIRVSVAMITYNHERFIRQAVESVMMQKGDFELELIVGEDTSPDGTKAILTDLKSKYPDKMKLIIREKNLGMMKNFVDVVERCDGDYVALIEGDDYWTDEHKLQKQIAFLEANVDFSMSYHNAEIMHLDGSKTLANDHGQHEGTTSDLILSKPFSYMMTASMVYRREALHKFPSWFVHLNAADRALPILVSQSGKVGFLDDVMSVYRRHDQGISNRKRYNYFMQGSLDLMNHLLKELGSEFRSDIRTQKSKIYLQWALIYREHYNALFRPLWYFFLSLYYNLELSGRQVKALIADDLFHDWHKQYKERNSDSG